MRAKRRRGGRRSDGNRPRPRSPYRCNPKADDEKIGEDTQPTEKKKSHNKVSGLG